MRQFGLIGYPLTHSFSKKYFSEKFIKENIADAAYDLYELVDIQNFPALVESKPNLKGLNVTIPHKQAVIPFLDALDQSAQKVGAVNVIKILAGGQKVGYNSDYYGFKQSLLGVYTPQPGAKALILGAGGATKAVEAALRDLGVAYQTVSRSTGKADLTYDQLSPELVRACTLIVNTTPLGMYPHTDQAPEIPYQYLTPQHLLFDLVYNPAETLFMQKGKAQGASVINGLEMLHLQAEKAWEIFNQ